MTRTREPRDEAATARRVRVRSINPLDAAEVRAAMLSRLRYEPETGEFIRIASTRNGNKVGEVAGCLLRGYVKVALGGCGFMAHRLAWLYVHGQWPSEQIDHINGIKSDNRLSNLRDVTAQTNSQNQRHAMNRNKLGLLGVYRRLNLYIASISVQGKPRRVGSFRTAEEAHAAYLAAKRELHQGNTL